MGLATLLEIGAQNGQKKAAKTLLPFETTGESKTIALKTSEKSDKNDFATALKTALATNAPKTSSKTANNDAPIKSAIAPAKRNSANTATPIESKTQSASKVPIESKTAGNSKTPIDNKKLNFDEPILKTTKKTQFDPIGEKTKDSPLAKLIEKIDAPKKPPIEKAADQTSPQKVEALKIKTDKAPIETSANQNEVNKTRVAIADKFDAIQTARSDRGEKEQIVATKAKAPPIEKAVEQISEKSELKEIEAQKPNEAPKIKAPPIEKAADQTKPQKIVYAKTTEAKAEPIDIETDKAPIATSDASKILQAPIENDYAQKEQIVALEELLAAIETFADEIPIDKPTPIAAPLNQAHKTNALPSEPLNQTSREPIPTGKSVKTLSSAESFEIARRVISQLNEKARFIDAETLRGVTERFRTITQNGSLVELFDFANKNGLNISKIALSTQTANENRVIATFSAIGKSPKTPSKIEAKTDKASADQKTIVQTPIKDAPIVSKAEQKAFAKEEFQILAKPILKGDAPIEKPIVSVKTPKENTSIAPDANAQKTGEKTPKPQENPVKTPDLKSPPIENKKTDLTYSPPRENPKNAAPIQAKPIERQITQNEPKEAIDQKTIQTNAKPIEQSAPIEQTPKLAARNTREAKSPIGTSTETPQTPKENPPIVTAQKEPKSFVAEFLRLLNPKETAPQKETKSVKTTERESVKTPDFSADIFRARAVASQPLNVVVLVPQTAQSDLWSEAEFDASAIKRLAPQTEGSDESVSQEERLTDAAQTNPSKRLEVRGEIARYAARFFATRLNEAIENYKPPITRLTIAMNPEGLGEVGVTLITRGDSLIVSSRSAPHTIALLIAHSAEIRQNLAQAGFDRIELQYREDQSGERDRQKEEREKQKNRKEEEDAA
ncbi:MAG: flagellar hook-length control protein FliK [Helicobacteraceae bacterium]|jgi:hypothetical protein|nr:flagellar hook-length control protein FliK [Helicobacteraceae bacterium]